MSKIPVMSAEEAVADILASDNCLLVHEAPEFIEELARRGYRLKPITADGESLRDRENGT